MDKELEEWKMMLGVESGPLGKPNIKSQVPSRDSVRWKCNICSYRRARSTTFDMVRHFRSTHPKEYKQKVQRGGDLHQMGLIAKECKCSVCKYFTSDRNQLNLHCNEAHDIEGKNVCYECGEAFKLKPDLVAHIKGTFTYDVWNPLNPLPFSH